MPSALHLAAGDPRLTDAVRRSRKLLHKRALYGAAASAVPVPGLDWMVDAALLSRLIPEINSQFGLSATQIDRLASHDRDRVQKAVAMVGSVLIGKFVTRDLVVKAAQHVGVRMTAKQAARYIPLAGQAVSAVLGYTALRYLGEEHLKDCVRVALAAQHRLPTPQDLRTVDAPARPI